MTRRDIRANAPQNIYAIHLAIKMAGLCPLINANNTLVNDSKRPNAIREHPLEDRQRIAWSNELDSIKPTVE